MQFDLDRIRGRVPAVPLAPIVADRVRKYVSRAAEARGGDAAADLRVALEAVLCVLVPEVKGAVGAGGAEGAVHGVERDCVNGVDFGDVALRGVGLAVAFEGEVEAVGGRISIRCLEGLVAGRDKPSILILDVLDRAPPFNRPDREARRIAEAAHDARLPLQRTRNRLVDLGRVLQVDHVDVALGGRDNKQLVLDVHAVDALARVERGNGLCALEVPEFDRLVPGAGCDVVSTARLEPAHAFDTLGVRFGLLRGDLAAGGGSTEVDDVEVAGGVAGGEACAVLSWSQSFILYLYTNVHCERTLDHPRPRTWPWHSNSHFPFAPWLLTS
jgi:hypothetical protein